MTQIWKKKSGRVQSLNNKPHHNTDLGITRSCCGNQIFYHKILQRNYRKIAMNGHFPIIPL